MQLNNNLSRKKNRHEIQTWSSFQEKTWANPTEIKVVLHAQGQALQRALTMCVCLWFSKQDPAPVPSALTASGGWEAAGVRREHWTSQQALQFHLKNWLACCLGLRSCSWLRSRSWGGTTQVVWSERLELAQSQVGQTGGAKAGMARAPWTCGFEREQLAS